MKFVQISHPEVEADAVVSERAAAAYAQRGWQIDALVDEPTPVDDGPRELKRPQKNDSTAAWRTYAVALGAENDGLSVTEAFDMSRDDLVAKYAPADPKPSAAPKAKAPRKRAASRTPAPTLVAKPEPAKTLTTPAKPGTETKEN